MMWLSTRTIRGKNDLEWLDYLDFIGLSQLTEVRSLDSWCNPPVNDSQVEPLFMLDQLDHALNRLPLPQSTREYYLLMIEAKNEKISVNHPQLKFLGYDLSDGGWTSSLLNCGRWEGILAPIAQRVNQYGLLNWEDACLAQSLLPDAWNQDSHAFVTIWGLFEVLNPKKQH